MDADPGGAGLCAPWTPWENDSKSASVCIGHRTSVRVAACRITPAFHAKGKCGAESHPHWWDASLGLWRAKCSSESIQLSGKSRKSPHEGFSPGLPIAWQWLCVIPKVCVTGFSDGNLCLLRFHCST